MKPAARKLLRWTAIAIACVAGIVVFGAIAVLGSGHFRSFYMPSEGMAPTLEKRDRFVAIMDGARALRRGDVVLFPVGESMYVKRVAALAGDTIGMRNGVVILDGKPVPQRFLRQERRSDFPDGPVRRRAEHFPGEAAPPEILDLGPSELDDVPERRVPAGFLFVLGDHRDRSADSRVERDRMGVELLPVSDVRGHALFYTWPREKIGRRVGS
ncbi:MAG: signal peptidase [Sphingomonadales bacterium]|nr:signal peptidase [Sphingomonadales bacterium]